MVIGMPRCGCTQSVCSCVFEDTESVEWSGSGSVSDPFIATPTPLLVVDDTSTLALDLEFSEDTATLSAQVIGGGHAEVFTADGTWNKPAGATFVRVMLIGAGGGGASGDSASGAPGMGTDGGSGGDAGQVAIFTLVDADIPATAAVVVGQGGLGGAAVSSASGNDGSDGGDSSFDTFVAPGGAGGVSGNGAPAHGPQGMPPGQFASGGTTFDVFTPAHNYLAPGAGGHGESASYAVQAGGYSQPGQGSRYPDDTGGGAAGGGDGRDEPVTKMGGGGGGGEGGSSGGFHGGNGGLYGGGGGGGGYAAFGNSAGAGGDGANGIVVVIAW